jgi:DNA adenine methylase
MRSSSGPGRNNATVSCQGLLEFGVSAVNLVFAFPEDSSLSMPVDALSRKSDSGQSVVNVASVPQRSPFRYAGGKTWLVPVIRQWLRSLTERPHVLVEPFAGGGTVALTSVFEDYVDRAILIEKDPDVAAVWQSIFDGNGARLANDLAGFDLNLDTVTEVLARLNPTTLDRAFATIIRNRVNRGGILAPGAGLIKDGENGKGLRSRWYPETLRRRILSISELRGRLSILSCDGTDGISTYGQSPSTAFFIDPPYTKAGRRLYRFSEIDHEALFDVASRVTGPFLMTYDHSPEIELLARRHRLETALIPMKSTHHAHKLELLVSKDLRWLTSRP